MQSEEMSLALAFTDQSPSYTYGFEAGQIWALLDELGPPIVDRGWSEGFPVREENAEVYRRMASRFGYAIEIRDVGHGWMGMRLTFAGGRQKPALSVVGENSDAQG